MITLTMLNQNAVWFSPTIEENDMNNKSKNLYPYLLFAAFLILIVLNFSKVWGFALALLKVFEPLIWGFAIAYILNLLMTWYETLYFPKKSTRAITATRRPVCLLLSVITIFAILSLIIGIVVPQLVETAKTLGEATPVFINKAEQWISEREQAFPAIAELVEQSNINWQEMQNSIFAYFTQGLGSLLQSSVSIAGAFASVSVNLLLGFVFSFYLLTSKEKVHSQLLRLERRFLPERYARRVNHVLAVADHAFSSFFTVQCFEAVVLGSLCTVGMLLFGFPYAGTVGVFVGATALIPILGAYLGAAVGTFLILVVSPIKALGFVVFVLVLQQLEGNFIYPRVVGNSIGLPGIWVLAAIIIFGGIAGVAGMLLGVPVMAVIYTLLKEATEQGEKQTDRQQAADPPKA